MTRTRKTKATANAAEAVQAPEPPDAYLKRHMANMEGWSFETLQRAIAGGVSVQLSVQSVAVEVTGGGYIVQRACGSDRGMSPNDLAAAAGLLLGAARAQQATDDSSF